jgi:hypothetical protein
MDSAAAAAEAGAATNAVAEAGTTKPEGGKKRTVTIRLEQAYIDSLLKEYPMKPLPFYPGELEKNVKDPVCREIIREVLGPALAVLKNIEDRDEAIIKQYHEQGYAEQEIEVDDDDDDEEAYT